MREKIFLSSLWKDDGLKKFLYSFLGKKKIYIYGAGYIARQVLEYMICLENITVEALIVSDGQKHSNECTGVKVLELSELPIYDDCIFVVAIRYPTSRDIVSQLDVLNVDSKYIYEYEKEPEQYVSSFSYINTNWEVKSSEKSFFSLTYLNTLGEKYGTDKASKFRGEVSHDYLNKYEFYFKGLKNEKIKIMELGIAQGASLKMWKEYFRFADIFGVDCSPGSTLYEEDRIKVIVTDLAFVDNIKKIGLIKPNIIIDDASHLWSHQIKSLFYLFPNLASNGIYIIEDLETSFGAMGYNDASINTYDVLSAINEVVCSREHLRLENYPLKIRDIAPEIEELAMQIETMTFFCGSCIMIKSNL